jgi:hypothetical protein
MEEGKWEKDKTPYLIFECKKCKQYLYVKTTQKWKKCLRCGRNHVVSNILNSGEIVNGMTAAVEIVKKKQNEFGKKELGSTPEFRTHGDFTITIKKLDDRTLVDEKSSKETSSQFRKILTEISLTYKKFPLYTIEIMAEDFGIPSSKLKHLTKRFLKKGILVQVDDSYYTVKQE